MVQPYNQGISQSAAGFIFGGTDTIAAPAIAQALNGGTALRCRGVTLQAPSTNTINVRVGGSGVLAGTLGVEIAPGGSFPIAIDDVAKVFIIASGAGEVIDWVLLR